MKDLGLEWRYAAKNFDPDRPLDDVQKNYLLETLRMAPSSFGLQPWKFISVEDTGLRERIKEAAWNQPKVTEAPMLVVLCCKRTIEADDIDGFVEYMAAERGQEPADLQPYREMIHGFVGNIASEDRMHWTARQTYVALGFLLMAAGANGIDACPIEGFEPEKVDEILGLTGGDYGSIVLCALGHRSEQDKYAGLKKVRYAKDRVIEVR